jgi:galactokinase
VATEPTRTAPPPIARRIAAEARERWHLEGSLFAAWAPGRVNLIGEHTDYNDGWVLPISVARVVCLSGQVQRDGGGTVRLYSPHYRQTAQFEVSSLPTAGHDQGQPLWARYVAGVVAALQEREHAVPGFSVALDGDVPLGGGMSSSAALIVATLTWLDVALGLGLAPLDVVHLGQLAEYIGSGVRVGVLDHAASVLGSRGHATLIDCRSLEYHHIPFALPDTRLLICDSGVSRSLVATAYNERRAECEAGLRALSAALGRAGEARPMTALRDVSWDEYLFLGGEVPQPARRRVRHVLSENGRTLDAVEALRRGDAEGFGRLVLASHASLRDDYEVSCAELDAIVEIAMGVPGAFGARMIGAGFGGGALIVAGAQAVEGIKAALRREYPARAAQQPTISDVEPDGGPGSVWLDA